MNSIETVRLARQIAGGAIVTLLMISSVTQAQQAAPAAGETPPPKESVPAKLNTIIIPKFDIADTSVEDAIEFLRVRAAQFDVGEKDPAKRGLHFDIRKPLNPAAPAAPSPKIRELRLHYVPVGMALKYICEQANLSYTVDENTIIISPKTDAGAVAAAPADPAKMAVIQGKLKSITIPKIDFQKTSLEDAIEFLRVRATHLDVGENDPAKKGINFVIRHPAGGPPPLIHEIRLRNAPISEALKSICDQTKFRYTVDDYAVILSPQDEAAVEPAKPPVKGNP